MAGCTSSKARVLGRIYETEVANSCRAPSGVSIARSDLLAIPRASHSPAHPTKGMRGSLEVASGTTTRLSRMHILNENEPHSRHCIAELRKVQCHVRFRCSEVQRHDARHSALFIPSISQRPQLSSMSRKGPMPAFASRGMFDALAGDADEVDEVEEEYSPTASVSLTTFNMASRFASPYFVA